MTDEVFEPDAIDFYDWGELEKLQEKKSQEIHKALFKGKKRRSES